MNTFSDLQQIATSRSSRLQSLNFIKMLNLISPTVHTHRHTHTFTLKHTSFMTRVATASTTIIPINHKYAAFLRCWRYIHIQPSHTAMQSSIAPQHHMLCPWAAIERSHREYAHDDGVCTFRGTDQSELLSECGVGGGF